MRYHAKLKWIVALAVLGYAPSSADADPSKMPQLGRYFLPTTDPSLPSTGSVSPTPQQELNEANALLSSAKNVSTAIAADLAQARTDHDVVKMLCLNDKLNQIDAAVTLISTRMQQLANAVGAKDTDLANHEYTILSVLGQRVSQLQTEANKCIGNETTNTNSTTTTNVDPGMTPIDVTIPPFGGDTTAPPIDIPVGPTPSIPPPTRCSPQK